MSSNDNNFLSISSGIFPCPLGRSCCSISVKSALMSWMSCYILWKYGICVRSSWSPSFHLPHQLSSHQSLTILPPMSFLSITVWLCLNLSLASPEQSFSPGFPVKPSLSAPTSLCTCKSNTNLPKNLYLLPTALRAKQCFFSPRFLSSTCQFSWCPSKWSFSWY